MSTTTRIKLARANLPSHIADPTWTRVFGDLPKWMYFPPQVFEKDGNYVRIWRSPLVDITELGYRRLAAVVELTDIESEFTKGLYWTYGMNDRSAWSDYQYMVYGHFPHGYPVMDLVAAYKHMTYEIRHVIERMGGTMEFIEKRRRRAQKRGGA